MVPKIIIDTDAGLDDAMAIFMALEAHKNKDIEIIAITTVNGNTNVLNVNRNVLRTLQAACQLQIPVYSGAERGLVCPFIFPGKPFHGEDGFGDILDSEPPSGLIIKEEFAPLALVRIIKELPDEIILVALGPLTNIAIAINICPKLTVNLKDFYVMGGNIHGSGNITVMGEFNFVCDPEAAKVVLDRSLKMIKLAPWETCMHSVLIPYEERIQLGLRDTSSAKLLNLIEEKIMKGKIYENYITCDQLSMAWMLDEWTKQDKKKTLVTEVEELHATVELSGSHSRGLMVIDDRNRIPRVKNVLVMKKLNKDVYMNYLQMAFSV